MRHLPGGDPGNNYLLPWELECLMLEHGWRVVDGWGEWGDDLYGEANDAHPSLRHADRKLAAGNRHHLDDDCRMRLLATDYWLLATGCWLLASGYRRPVTRLH